MARYVGLHTLPVSPGRCSARRPRRSANSDHQPSSRPTASFKDGKVVCEWESPGKAEVAAAYQKLGFPFDEIVQVDAICDAGAEGVTTNDL